MTDSQKSTQETSAQVAEKYTPDRGLTASQVSELREAGKGNNVAIRAGRSTWDIIRANVFTRINAMLGVLFIIVLSTGSIINSAFGLLIIANSGIGIIQEIRAKRTLEKLSIVGQSDPTVRREGEDSTVNRADIVQGDLILLSSGDQILVDGEVRQSRSLTVDESLLTGESDPVEKKEGDVVLSGAFVVSGSGMYQATRVGADSYASRLAGEASSFSLTNSQLMAGINRILRVITWLLIPTGILTIYMQLFQTGQPLRQAILAMAAALVPMVPEGLVLMTSVAFAVGVIRLGRQECLVQELPAIEGLARVDVVCTDKTGTLTDNSMTVRGVDSWEGVSDEDQNEAIQAVCAMAKHDEDPNDSMKAIVEWMEEQEDYQAAVAEWDVTDVVPFSSDKKWSGMSFGDKGHWLLGAPDVLSDPDSEAGRYAEEKGSTGLRVMMIARSDCPVSELAHVSASTFIEKGDIVPLAVVVVEQSLREDAQSTLEYFRQEGVDVKVISGDNATSVGAVAASLEMDGADSPLDARKLPSLPPSAFRHVVNAVGQRKEDNNEETQSVRRSSEVLDFARDVEHHTVFGRVTPEQKRFMVGALQSHDHTVAMTGDGVNDVLALKRADIGVAMGSGSSAARAVAQIVLLNNAFSSLPAVVAEGRRVIGNIERVASLFLTKTVYSVMLAITMILLNLPFPFQPIHVTITGWFTIGIPAFLLSLAPNTDRARDNFVGRVLRLAIPSGVIVGLATCLTYAILRHHMVFHDAYDVHVSTASLAALIIAATWVLCIVARPLTWWKVLLVVLSAAMYPIMFCWPVSAHFFRLDATSWSVMRWGILAGVCAAVLIEVLWWILGWRYGDRRFVWARSWQRYQQEQREEERERSARVRQEAGNNTTDGKVHIK